MLDARGGGRLTIDALPAFKRPAQLLFEASFADPNGQIQPLAQAVQVWPDDVQPGTSASRWVGVDTQTQINGLACSHPVGTPPSVPIHTNATTPAAASNTKTRAER